MENTVHIDEKWFYLTTKNCRFYLTPTEADPLRVTKSKNFVPKVMFMAAVSRPVFDEAGVCIFYGKIGIWPFVGEVTAQRDIKFRKKDTKEMKLIQSITREVIKKKHNQSGILLCLFRFYAYSNFVKQSIYLRFTAYVQFFINAYSQIIPAIKEKWPPFLSRSIRIQQDNAITHIKPTDVDFYRNANSDSFHISLVQQPPNSPDCNTLDLGFLTAIQSLQQRIRCKNAEELIEAVKKSFEDIEAMSLNKVFLSMVSVLIEILKVKGGNNYKFPHMKKDSLLRQGILPQNLEVSQYLVRECVEFLMGEDHYEGIRDIMA